MSASITVDTTWAERAMERLAYLQKRSIMDIHKQMFGEHIRRMQTKKVPQPESLKQGRDAIEADLSRIVLGMDSSGSATREPDKHGYYTYTASNGAVWKVASSYMDPSGSKLARHHQMNRQSRGRVSKRNREYQFGGYTVIHKLHVNESRRKAYLRKVWKHVGRFKSGWNAAARGLRTKTPNWILRHGVSRGTFRHIHGRDIGFLEAVNRIDYAHSRLKHYMNYSEALQAKRLKHIARGEMRKLAKQYNSARAV